MEGSRVALLGLLAEIKCSRNGSRITLLGLLAKIKCSDMDLGYFLPAFWLRSSVVTVDGSRVRSVAGTKVLETL